jgi:hypothetical protein
MAEIINLNKRRKAAAKAAADTEAAANRARFGRTKAARAADTRQEEARRALLAGKRLDPDRPPR